MFNIMAYTCLLVAPSEITSVFIKYHDVHGKLL